MAQTVFYDKHVAAGGKFTEFAGYLMPVQYSEGIFQEHLNTRKFAGLFDISHMGRFICRGDGALAFLQYILSNDAAALTPGWSQYTSIPDSRGGAIDDAYLFRSENDEFILVVNAANKTKDWHYLAEESAAFSDVELLDITDDLAMAALQGPESERILKTILGEDAIPARQRNAVKNSVYQGEEIMVCRSGYTGEPVCFEIMLGHDCAGALWDNMMTEGAYPVGLGARDTLRLEASLPLYGHEFGVDYDNLEIPILACPHAKFAVSFSERKGDFVGGEALFKQAEALEQIKKGDFSNKENLPKRIRPFKVTGKGIVREGAEVVINNEKVGNVTSGTIVPHWEMIETEHGLEPGDKTEKRALGLALVDSEISIGQEVEFRQRKKSIEGRLVKRNLRTRNTLYAIPE